MSLVMADYCLLCFSLVPGRGVTLYFDGLKSPGVDDPKKYPFLLTEKQINQMRIDPGEDSPRFWTMRRGFLPPDGLVWAVLTEQMIAQYHVQQKALWESRPVRVVGCDPAYSTDGDKCILQPALVGKLNTGAYGIEFGPPIEIMLHASTKSSMLDRLTSDIVSHLHQLDCAIENFGMDTTGNQWMLADAIEEKFNKQGMKRVSFSGLASRDPISLQDPRVASELYANKVTELWGRFGVYIKNDMIRGLSSTTCKQFCVRLLDFDKGNTRRVRVEPKTVLRERLGYSPDEADAAVVALEVIRSALGILPEKAASIGGVSSSGSLEKLALIEEEMMLDDSCDDDGLDVAFGEDFDMEEFDV